MRTRTAGRGFLGRANHYHEAPTSQNLLQFRTRNTQNPPKNSCGVSGGINPHFWGICGVSLGGEIGIHEGLKIPCRKACRFDPDPRHHVFLTDSKSPAIMLLKWKNYANGVNIRHTGGAYRWIQGLCSSVTICGVWPLCGMNWWHKGLSFV